MKPAGAWEGRRAKRVAFYAFKGGTGRTFALAHAAWYLSRQGHRVVVVDLDLTAPSMWSLLSPRQEPRSGVLEYVVPRRGASVPDVRDLLEEVPLDTKARGVLYLVQAGRLDTEYLERLQALDWSGLVADDAPGSQLPLFRGRLESLLEAIDQTVAPDVILLDAPTGYNDTSNLCLRLVADLVVALFAPTRVHLDGVSRVVSSLSTQYAARKRPDVFCVASTILFSRLGGISVRRIQAAFEFLDRVRYEALGSPPTLDVESEDLVHQDPAIVSYDERLAALEQLPTSEEPRATHFAPFQELLDYVEGALPSPRLHVELPTGDKPALLEDLRSQFGLFAEHAESADLEAHFLRTHHLEALEERRVALVLGGKGSGKTALYLYSTNPPSAQTLRGHGPGVGLSADLLCSLQDRVPAFDVVWRAYLLRHLPDELLEPIGPSLVEAVRILRVLETDLSRMPRLIELLTGDEVGAQLDHAWRLIDAQLERSGRNLRICLDGLDTAFKADRSRRDRGLVALLTAWQITFSRLQRIELKIFLRNDLWERLSFPEKSHLRGRELHLNWDEGNLWRLVVKRALTANSFSQWIGRFLPPPILAADQAENAALEQIHPYLDLLFERQIWAGKNSLSRSWILRRLADAKGTTFPRDLICLLNEAMKAEEHRVREGARVSRDAVLSRQALAEALIPTSRQRTDAVQEEYPELADVLPVLSGVDATGSTDTLIQRLGQSAPGSAAQALDLLVEAGVVHLHEDGYQVPDLYRHGLNMPRRGPR